MICEQVHNALSRFQVCEETADGARVATHCLYPSFEPVYVFVARLGEGYRVHDAAGAVRSAWVHGRDDLVVRRALADESAKFGLKIEEGSLVAEPSNEEWLPAAILAVANASAAAANKAVEHVVAAAENALKSKIYTALVKVVPPKVITKEYPYLGRSGKMYHFDYVILEKDDRAILIDGVSPHHVSVAAKYMAFSDTRSDAAMKFAVHERELDASDASLMQQVADLVPIQSLQAGVKRAYTGQGMLTP